MKKYIVFLSLFFNMIVLSGQGIDFFHGSWAEAKAKAKETGRLVFVDAFTVWCGPCKMMAKNIFPLQDVGDYYNNNFVNYKFDMEKGEGPNFAKEYSIRAYPTLLFIDGDGKLVHTKVGGTDAGGFIELGKTAVGKYDSSPAYAARYDAGDHSPQLVYYYIKALNQANKSSQKIANEFLSTYKEKGNDWYYKIIYEATVQSDSKPFDYFIKEEKNIATVYDPKAVLRRKYNALLATAQKSLEYQSPDLKEDALKQAKKTLDKKQFKVFGLEADFQKAVYEKNDSSMYETASELAANLYEGHPSNVFGIMNTLKLKNKKDKKSIPPVKKLYQAETDATKNPKVRLDFAYFLYSIGENAEALAQAEKAKADAVKNEADITDYDNAILFLKSKV